MRVLSLIVLLGALAACSGAPDHALPSTSGSDPTWQLNPGRWTFNENKLTMPLAR